MKIFFNQKATHRKRQRETVEFCPKEIEKIVPAISDFQADINLTGQLKGKEKFKSRLARFIPLHLIKINDKDLAKKADYIYVWGGIPVGINKPYVIELDNPYCLCYYNPLWMNLFGWIVRPILLSAKCKRIVCISKACQNTLEAVLGEKVKEKSTIVYPYISENYKTVEERPIKKRKINFLFVSTTFLLKGGREVLEAFQRVYNEGYDIHLTMVTRMPDEYRNKYDNCPWLTIQEANLDKSILYKSFFSKADVFILPSYQDSFGLVYLEALSFGLPVIATDIYAIPEMVQDGYSGLLVKAPILFFNTDYTLDNRMAFLDMTEKIESDGLYENVVIELCDAIKKITNEEVLQEFASNTKKIFRERFSEQSRNASFLSLFK